MTIQRKEEDMTVDSNHDDLVDKNDTQSADATDLGESDADTIENNTFNEESEERKKLTGEIDSEEEENLTGEDYPKLFEKYQERFYKAYSISQTLFTMEKMQREVMNFYQRRNNAILDVLKDSDEESQLKEAILDDTDKTRLTNLISMNKKLEGPLSNLLAFDNSNIGKNKWLDLFISESIPDLIEDDLIDYELNPQDSENWSHRHYPNMVISKFKPISTKYSTHFSDLKELHTSSNSSGTSTKKRRLNDN